MKFQEWIDGDKICIIMRGLPGSGKSYKVNQLLAKYGGDAGHVFSADKYFEKLGDSEFIRRYRRPPTPAESKEAYRQAWKPFRLGAAHKDCFQQFKAAIDLGITPLTRSRRKQTEPDYSKGFQGSYMDVEFSANFF